MIKKPHFYLLPQRSATRRKQEDSLFELISQRNNIYGIEDKELLIYLIDFMKTHTETFEEVYSNEFFTETNTIPSQSVQLKDNGDKLEMVCGKRTFPTIISYFNDNKLYSSLIWEEDSVQLRLTFLNACTRHVFRLIAKVNTN